ncbi:putative transposase [Legionella pneumophila]|nr:Uncharacterised protein [Legionella pneumophila]CZP25551.1 Uncharacterised protein [Legionella pneumophila]CZP60811.1 Uncharacterised protein [Legionella pneumophila]CZP60821.1 Uncharacterised protein [Legionella pneumophila]CZP75472.1 Uncharacterised protein [Legionella pneumophila]
MSITELSDILNGYFSWNKSRIECFATMLISLIKVRTVNLTEIACGFSSPAKQDSRHTRIKRFFREFKIDFSRVGRSLRKTVVKISNFKVTGLLRRYAPRNDGPKNRTVQSRML